MVPRGLVGVPLLADSRPRQRFHTDLTRTIGDRILPRALTFPSQAQSIIPEESGTAHFLEA